MSRPRALSAQPPVTDWDDLPLICDVADVQRLYRVGESTAYDLLNDWFDRGRAGRVAGRLLIPRWQLCLIVNQGSTFI